MKPHPTVDDQTFVEHPASGRWHSAQASDRGLNARQQDALQRLRPLPYLAGAHPAPAQAGVTVHLPEKSQPGLNLYNSGHGPEALLVDLEGTVLHRWSYAVDRIWPHQPTAAQGGYWRRVTWLPDGDVLAVFEGIGLIRLDRESRLKWAFPRPVHHQAVPGLNGEIWTLVRRHRVVPRFNPEQPIVEDFLARLTSDGEWLDEFSLLEAFENSPYRHLLRSSPREGDIFHTNSIEVLDGRFAARAPWLKRGNLLLSIYFLDTVCVVDPLQKQVVWALQGGEAMPFKGQHDPRMLPSGNLLLFDNWGRGDRSRVIEFDPLSPRILWQYPNDPEADFATPTCGASQRLPNGNTLITESDRGRALEVTRTGEVVWEFVNPHRAGEQDELIATLFEVRRIPADYFSW